MEVGQRRLLPNDLAPNVASIPVGITTASFVFQSEAVMVIVLMLFQNTTFLLTFLRNTHSVIWS